MSPVERQMPAHARGFLADDASLHKNIRGTSDRTNLLATTQTEHQVQCRLLLDVVIAQCPAIFQLLTSKNQSLLVWWNAYELVR